MHPLRNAPPSLLFGFLHKSFWALRGATDFRVFASLNSRSPACNWIGISALRALWISLNRDFHWCCISVILPIFVYPTSDFPRNADMALKVLVASQMFWNPTLNFTHRCAPFWIHFGIRADTCHWPDGPSVCANKCINTPRCVFPFPPVWRQKTCHWPVGRWVLFS